MTGKTGFFLVTTAEPEGVLDVLHFGQFETRRLLHSKHTTVMLHTTHHCREGNGWSRPKWEGGGKTG